MLQAWNPLCKPNSRAGYSGKVCSAMLSRLPWERLNSLHLPLNLLLCGQHAQCIWW